MPAVAAPAVATNGAGAPAVPVPTAAVPVRASAAATAAAAATGAEMAERPSVPESTIPSSVPFTDPSASAFGAVTPDQPPVPPQPHVPLQQQPAAAPGFSGGMPPLTPNGTWPQWMQMSYGQQLALRFMGGKVQDQLPPSPAAAAAAAAANGSTKMSPGSIHAPPPSLLANPTALWRSMQLQAMAAQQAQVHVAKASVGERSLEGEGSAEGSGGEGTSPQPARGDVAGNASTSPQAAGNDAAAS
mmetsp:Transcript_10317/g.33822  ORF Transcript_10317/g.33822 Transcript_10317/m.33822 type:complete len:244 (+) Transcript_10317:934-1665(+)